MTSLASSAAETFHDFRRAAAAQTLTFASAVFQRCTSPFPVVSEDLTGA